jgi:hypothetical protein
MGDTLQQRIPFLSREAHKHDGGTGWPEEEAQGEGVEKKARESGIPY